VDAYSRAIGCGAACLQSQAPGITGRICICPT